MPKTQVSCPNCRQMLVVEIEQLFDLAVDPSAKTRLLTGVANLLRCPYCGYQGTIATPIVYHDPQKELLLTFVPPELGLPRNEQERLIGALINQVINRLPPEKRKGYLLNPQSTLTLQGLVERILEADGITREMIQAQQQKINLLQRLANISDESTLAEIARQEDAQMDGEFFSLLNRLVEVALANNDRESARRLVELQKKLLPLTTYGRQVQEQAKEIEAAIADLRALGKDLSREKVLELLLNAPNETRLSALVGLAHPALDYTFFQMLSERIEQAEPAVKERLLALRAQLLEMTQEINRQVEAHRQAARRLIEGLLAREDATEALIQVLPEIDETFVIELQKMLSEARQNGQLERSTKLQQLVEALQRASTPPEVSLLEAYLDEEDDASRQRFLEQHAEEITPQFLDLLSNILVQVQAGEDRALADHVLAANRQALRFSMQRNLGSA